MINEYFHQQPFDVNEGRGPGPGVQITSIVLERFQSDPNWDHLDDHWSQVALPGLDDEGEGHLANEKDVVGLDDVIDDLRKIWLRSFQEVSGRVDEKSNLEL